MTATEPTLSTTILAACRRLAPRFWGTVFLADLADALRKAGVEWEDAAAELVAMHGRQILLRQGETEIDDRTRAAVICCEMTWWDACTYLTLLS